MAPSRWTVSPLPNALVDGGAPVAPRQGSALEERRKLGQVLDGGPDVDAAGSEVGQVRAERDEAGANAGPLGGQAVDVGVAHDGGDSGAESGVRLCHALAAGLEALHDAAAEHELERRSQVELLQRGL